jgi:hypothetical protein
MKFISRIVDYFKQTSTGERWTGGIGLLAGAGILTWQWTALNEGYFRYVTIAITLAYAVAAVISARELSARLKKIKVNEKNQTTEAKSSLSVLKASWKSHSEYLSMIALLGFGITQYRVALEIDSMIVQRNGFDQTAFIWAMVQAGALIGLLMFATLAISRKLALAKFDHDEAVEKFEKAQEKKSIDEQRSAVDVAREALEMAQAAVKVAQAAEETAKKSLEKVMEAQAPAEREIEAGQTPTSAAVNRA